ncbi:hypothetical protein AB1N83_013848 [Pleurotus pulmonarius]
MPPPSRPRSYPASASCAIKNTPERSTLYFEQRAKHVASKLFTSDRRPRRTYLITYLDDPLSLTGPLTYEEAHEQAMTYAKQVSSLDEQHARAVGFGLYTSDQSQSKCSNTTPSACWTSTKSSVYVSSWDTLANQIGS